jgi:hypothetical protein
MEEIVLGATEARSFTEVPETQVAPVQIWRSDRPFLAKLSLKRVGSHATCKDVALPSRALSFPIDMPPENILASQSTWIFTIKFQVC